MRIPLRALHQVEITSRCNLRCRYCPQYAGMLRPKQDMTFETFAKAIRWVKYFRDVYRQSSLNLAGIGESTIHPEFLRFVEHARAELSRPFELVLATNGLTMTEGMARALADSGVSVYVSLHRPEKAGKAVRLLGEAGCLAGVSADPSIAATDWAGQVKVDAPMAPRGTPCPWVRGGWGIVLSDGSISRCSFDATGGGVFSHVDMDLFEATTSAWKLCASCHQDVGVPLAEAV